MAEPKGAAETAPTADLFSNCGCPGMNGLRCSATPIGPTPGPPPPWGMQNVLCKLRWETSDPMIPGLVKPTWAFRLAPSR